MKKFTGIVIFLVMTAMLLALAACGQDSYENAPYILASDIYGIWTRETSHGSDTYTFNENGTYTKISIVDGDTALSRGTFEVYENKVDLYSTDTAKTVTHIVIFSDDKKTMKWGTGSSDVEYTKKDN